MSAFLTSKKDLSTIAFVWARIFADSKKESFETVVSNKDHAARLLEFNLDIESILFELLISDNLESLRARYSDCRDKNRNDLIESWTSETMEYEDPKLEKISNKDKIYVQSLYTWYLFSIRIINKADKFIKNKANLSPLIRINPSDKIKTIVTRNNIDLFFFI